MDSSTALLGQLTIADLVISVNREWIYSRSMTGTINISTDHFIPKLEFRAISWLFYVFLLAMSDQFVWRFVQVT
jgi:hypothetical protein